MSRFFKSLGIAIVVYIIASIFVGTITESIDVSESLLGFIYLILLLVTIAAFFIAFSRFGKFSKKDKESTNKVEKQDGSWLAKVGDIPEKQIVKSAWEWINPNAFGNNKYPKKGYKAHPTNAKLYAYWIGVTDKDVVVGRKRIHIDWDNLERVKPDQLELQWSLPLSDLRTVEMTTFAEFTGHTDGVFDRKFFYGGRGKNKKIMKLFSYVVHYDNFSYFDLKYSNVWVIYVFNSEGERLEVARTFDRDFAIKVHSKLKFLLEDMSSRQPKKPTEQDYL